MNRGALGILIGLAMTVSLAGAPGHAWTTVGDGIEYQSFTTAGPNNLFVCRMLRSNQNAIMETSLANGYVKGQNTQIVRYQAALCDDAINWWGQSWGARNDVICAVNGDFFTYSAGMTGGQVQSGSYVKRFGDWGGYSGFGWNVNRGAFLGGCVNHKAADQFVKYVATGNTQPFHGINIDRVSGGMVIYTTQYAATTPASSGAEVLVELTRPLVILKSPNYVQGYVRAIWPTTGSHQVPFDHIILSADGSAATTLLNNVTLGAEIRISQYPTDYNEPDTSGENGCSTPTGIDWQNVYSSVGVNYRFLENGAVRPPDPAHSGYAGLIVRNPRTAVAYNSTYIFLIVCDGRSGVSVGMTMTELGNWCISALGATDGSNLDGGGSSTMVVNGVVKNVPSDGSERAVANGLMMVNVLPKMQSTAFGTGALVKTTTGGTNVRLGPGTNYGVVASLPANTNGTVVEHSINGVYAKGYYWWKVDFSGTVGWVAETLLQGIPSPPSITQHPSPVASCTTGSAVFSVRVSGFWPMSYQWQKNQQNLSNGGRFSGADTNTLTISPLEMADAGNYRCVVTNIYGNATSNEAALTLGPGMSVSIGPPTVPYTRNGQVRYTLTYTNATTVTLATSDIILNKTGTATANPWVTGEGNTIRYVFMYPSGDGTLSISIPQGTATGCGVCPAAGPSQAVIVDNTAPGAVTVTDEGAWTPSLDALSASWTAAYEAGSGVNHYEYAIGTSPASQDVRGWTSAGTGQSVTASSLSLAESQPYYLQVRAVDNVGLVGGAASSDGITPAPAVNPISSAWPLPNAQGLAIRDKVVTAALGGAFWLEEADRSAAIKVVSSAPVSAGNKVDVAGVLGMSGPQRALIGDVVHGAGNGSVPKPLGTTQRSLMAKAFNPSTPGVTGGDSLYSIGLLVKCWGTVTYSDSTNPADRCFYFDDGSGLSDGAHPGIKVRCGSVGPPTTGMVCVTGIVSTEQVGPNVVPVLLIRTAADIIVV